MIATQNLPSTDDTPSSWIDANQRYLVQEFARLKAWLSGDDARAASRKVRDAPTSLSSPSAIDRVAGSFDLSGFERDLLLLCAGVELDADLAARCAAAARGANR